MNDSQRPLLAHTGPCAQVSPLCAQKWTSAFEENLQDKGFKEIRLRVAGDNARALHIYESSGYEVTGINMSKAIVNKNIK